MGLLNLHKQEEIQMHCISYVIADNIKVMIECQSSLKWVPGVILILGVIKVILILGKKKFEKCGLIGFYWDSN